jgi:type II secretory pathway component PulF
VLEPLLIVTMGVAIGGIVISMYLPMFSIYHAIQSKGSAA